MRFFSFIMAFWMLGLSCMPCMDAGQKNSQAKAATEISKTVPCQDDHEDECSPFCNCSCCSFFSINQPASISVYSLNVLNKTFASFLPENTSEISLPVWQPPQLY